MGVQRECLFLVSLLDALLILMLKGYKVDPYTVFTFNTIMVGDQLNSRCYHLIKFKARSEVEEVEGKVERVEGGWRVPVKCEWEEDWVGEGRVRRSRVKWWLELVESPLPTRCKRLIAVRRKGEYEFVEVTGEFVEESGYECSLTVHLWGGRCYEVWLPPEAIAYVDVFEKILDKLEKIAPKAYYVNVEIKEIPYMAGIAGLGVIQVYYDCKIDQDNNIICDDWLEWSPPEYLKKHDTSSLARILVDEVIPKTYHIIARRRSNIIKLHDQLATVLLARKHR